MVCVPFVLGVVGPGDSFTFSRESEGGYCPCGQCGGSFAGGCWAGGAMGCVLLVAGVRGLPAVG